MPRAYASYGSAASGTSKTAVNLFTTTAARPWIYEFNISFSGTPADVATILSMRRSTAVGTEGSGYTPVALDSADPAAVADAGVAHSVEPTYTASVDLWRQSLNQRATFRWVASPGRELIIPATANAGIGMQSISSGATPTMECHFQHGE